MPATFQPRRALGAFALFAAATAVLADPRSPAEARGRAIFREGIHADGTPLAAVTGEQAVPLPSAFVACIHCHGQAARGKTDGGITTSDIRWDTLAKPYELALAGGRRRGPYDATRFFDAITKGMDSSGRPLDPAMPRYRLSMTEASDLMAYLQEVGRSTDEGVTDSVVRIGFAMPTDPLQRSTAEADRRIVEAWLERVNRQGGVFRRRLEVVPVEASVAPAVLAVLASEWDERASATYAAARIPALRAIADPGASDRRYEFALYPGLVGRASALARRAIAHGNSARPQVALLYDPRYTSPAALHAVVAAVQPLIAILTTPLGTAPPDEAAREWRKAGVKSVLVLGKVPNFATVLSSAQTIAGDPLFLWTDPPGGSTGGRALGAQGGQAGEPSMEARADHAACVAQSGLTLSEGDQARQLSLLASARILVDALSSAGREVNREKLVESLEGLREIRSEFGPVGGFTPRRHTLVSRVLIAPLPGSRYRPDPEWVTID